MNGTNTVADVSAEEEYAPVTDTPVPGNTEATPQPAAQPAEKKKETTIQIPTSLVRWFLYSIFFQALLVPIAVFTPLNPWCTLSIAVILAHFAGQLNKLIDK
jgi:hypothetical protein